ncbi:hypothetical protein HGA88_00075 [Candidatus Roizmanbacteria bacterium]|nr:hypothetical protein [Candidatus Roizmanbacteria bacterium]
MLQKLIFGIVFFLAPLLLCGGIFAQENNKFGIHLAQPHDDDLWKAQKLVNSNGGDWGYITLVMQENDRDHTKWQNVFNMLSDMHLIPIIRLATKPEGGNWKRPSKEDADGWASFLNGLHWVVKDRYIILFNEPNHASEWGGAVDPVNYATVTKIFAQELKKKSDDFYLMLAGLDASTPSQKPLYEDEGYYLKDVIQTIGVQDFNTLFSGLSSHSYPNPGFIGSVEGTGKGSIRTYEWELDLLKQMGVKDLPVFITETGWDGEQLSRTLVGQNYQTAFQQVWLPDSRVQAVTPFILNYQSKPFLSFSFAKPGNSEYFPQYTILQSMSKVKGNPTREIAGEVICNLPGELVINSAYRFSCDIKNTGQTVIQEKDGYTVRFGGVDSQTYFFSSFNPIKPLQTSSIDLYVKTGSELKQKQTKIYLEKNGKTIGKPLEWEYKTIALPSLKMKIDLYPKLHDSGSDFQLQVFDEKEQLVYKVDGVQFSNKWGTIPAIYNIVFGKKYRVVLLKPYYLPRQEYVTFQKGENTVKFKMMYPLDFNRDGTFDFGDIVTVFQKPGLLNLFSF